jgi:hypothetical protein
MQLAGGSIVLAGLAMVLGIGQRGGGAQQTETVS